ncbi:MAG: CehA/McbA family metallohydrolase [Candidatus Binatia bacterium]|nr:CehA/McbA family metallohydrolase [Candidatus Binatia bacterium]
MVVFAVLESGCARDETNPASPAQEPATSPAAVAEPAPTAERSWAHPEIKAEMLADIETVRSPADGGGRAWIDGHEALGSRPEVTASTRARFPILYEAGPLGVADGGMIFLQVSPFWGWDTPQVVEEKGPGYTTVHTDAKGITLVPQTLGPQLLGIEIQGRALAPGERVRIDFGAGPSAAKVDRFAESDSKLWIAVDGDGDGVRKLIERSPGVDVRAARPALLYLALPGTARPGETVPLTVAVLDRAGNMGAPFEGDVRLELADGATGLDLPGSLTFTKEDASRRTVDVQARKAGLYRVRAKTDVDEARRSLEAESNPMLVGDAQRATLLWGDLQGHTQLSDGSATPAEYFEYGRDAAGLDFLAITDHDHWGLQALDANPQLWDQTVADVGQFHAPGRFVALLGFEWTNWVEGHRHVVHFGDDLEDLRVLSSLAPNLDTPPKLWGALRGEPVLTIAHHSAGGPVPIDWSIPPDPELEPVTEIASVHGSSESPDSPMPIYNPKPGNYVRDALDLGYRLGFTGGSDGHDGHPGLSQVAAGKSGVAAVWSASEEPRTRGALLDALRSRRSYATNGPRILVQTSLDGRPMGSDVPIAAGETPQRLAWNVAGTAPIERIDLIRSGEPRVSIPGEGKRELSGVADLPPLGEGDYLYLRVVQTDGGAAWTSPFFGGAPDDEPVAR